MKITCLLALLVVNSLGPTRSFNPLAIASRRSKSLQTTIPRQTAKNNDDDGGDDDDWFADKADFLAELDTSWGAVAESYSEDGSNTNGGNSYGRGPPKIRESSREDWGGGGRGRGSYGGGSQASYTRDTSRDNSNVDEAVVEDLLKERMQAKHRKDYDLADTIRDQLLNDYSVGVFDRERTWKTGCSPSGSGMPGRRNQRGDRNGRKSRDFGPNGHDYFESKDSGPHTARIEENQIHGMLAERLQAKMQRNFELADSIQATLIQSGVYVHDGMKEWRADGVPFGDVRGRDGQPGISRGSRADRNRAYTKSVHSEPVDGASDELIDKLVNQRANFKATREYDKADAVREGLQTKFNVLVDDRLREWSVNGDFGSEHQAQREMAEAFANRGYIQSGSSLPTEDQEHIQAQVEARHQAKRDRNFDLADSIREELQDEYDVMINDKIKLWSVGGDFGTDGGPKKPGWNYTRRGGGNLSEDQVQQVQSLLKDRFQAKREKDYQGADDIQQQLFEDCNVLVDDKNSEWHVDSDEYVPAGSNALGLPSEQIEAISAKVQKRIECKKQKDYEMADVIRDELKDGFGVLIDDRTKEWRQVDGSSLDDQEFVKEAAQSQSSAFQRTQQQDDSYAEEDNDPEEQVEAAAVGMSSSSSSVSAEELSSLTVAALKEQLRGAGLPVSGKKAELVERLVSAA